MGEVLQNQPSFGGKFVEVLLSDSELDVEKQANKLARFGQERFEDDPIGLGGELIEAIGKVLTYTSYPNPLLGKFLQAVIKKFPDKLKDGLKEGLMNEFVDEEMIKGVDELRRGVVANLLLGEALLEEGGKEPENWFGKLKERVRQLGKVEDSLVMAVFLGEGRRINKGSYMSRKMVDDWFKWLVRKGSGEEVDLMVESFDKFKTEEGKRTIGEFIGGMLAVWGQDNPQNTAELLLKLSIDGVFSGFVNWGLSFASIKGERWHNDGKPKLLEQVAKAMKLKGEEEDVGVSVSGGKRGIVALVVERWFLNKVIAKWWEVLWAEFDKREGLRINKSKIEELYQAYGGFLANYNKGRKKWLVEGMDSAMRVFVREGVQGRFSELTGIFEADGRVREAFYSILNGYFREEGDKSAERPRKA